MESLQSLRSRLIALQHKTPAHRLNDRDVVELLKKLIRRGLEICYSTSGKEYATPARLEIEVRDEIERQGRVQLLELPRVLGFSLEHVERTALKLVEKDPTIFLVDGQLMASSYLDTVAEEVDVLLSNTGMLPLSSLTVKYSLPSSFMKAQLELRQGMLLQAQFKENGSVLYTDLYIRQHLARLRGFLRGSTQPVSLKQFDKSLVSVQVKELLDKREVSGQFEGGVFTPASYLAARKNEAVQFFSDQQFITHTQFRELVGKADPSGILGEEAVKLKSGFASKDLIAATRAAVIGALERQDLVAVGDDFEWPGGELDIEEVLEGLPGVFPVEGFAYNEKLVEKAASACKHLITTVEESKRDNKRKKGNSVSLAEVEKIIRKSNVLKRHTSNPSLFSMVCQQVQARLSVQTQTFKEPPRKVQVTANLENDFAQLQVLIPAIEFVKAQNSNFGALTAYLVKTHFTQFFHNLLRIQLVNSGLAAPDVIQANNRAKLISELPDYLKVIFTGLLEAISQKNCETFLQILADNAREIPAVTLMPLNKKTKKTCLTRLQDAATVELKAALETKNLPEVFNSAARARLLENCLVHLPLPTDQWAQDLLANIYEKAFSQQDPVLRLWRLKDSDDPNQLIQGVADLLNR